MPRYLKVLLFFIRITIYCIPALLFSFLVYKNLAVNGNLEAVYDFKEKSPFISVLRPQGRLGEIKKDSRGSYFQEVKDEPVYFDIRLPRPFQRVEVGLEYKNIDQPIFELGAMTDKERWQFDLKPVENKVINFLLQDKFHWNYTEENGTFFFQKNKKYKTLQDFLSSSPSVDSIATYNYTYDKAFAIKGYKAKDGGVQIHKTLRGSHRMYTYIKDEDLNFSFWFQDLNRHAGDDYVSMDIYHDSSNVYRDFFKIDEDAKDSRKISRVKEKNIILKDMDEGVYRIDVTTPSDDIFIRKASTTQDYLVFINTIYFGDNSGYSDDLDEERSAPTKIYSNGAYVAGQTTHIEGLQTMLVGKKVLNINETHKKFYTEAQGGLDEILIPRNDVSIETKGMISFSQNSFFNPETTSLADGRDFDQQRIGYVIAKYSRSKGLDDGWAENVVSFDVQNYYTQDDEMHFVLSLPYIKKNEPALELRKIKVKYFGEPMHFSTIIKKIQEYVGSIFTN